MKKLMMTAMGAAACCAATAATVYVSPTGDDAAAGTADAPKRTLQLVLSANAWKNGDELVLLPGTYHLQTQKTESAAMASEKGALHFNGTGVIRGATGNPADVVIDGDGATECIRVASNDLLIHGITFQNGSQGAGAAIGSNLSIQSANVLVSNCVIRGTAPTSTLPAVGLEVGSRLTHCTFQDLKGSPRPNQLNTSGLYLRGTNVVENCRFIDCVTTNIGMQYAALMNGAAGSTIRNCTFLRTIERPLTLFGDAVVEGCSFVSNRVTSSTYGSGGAIYVRNDAGGAVITNCVFDGNAATNHGGAIAYSTSKANPVRITGCVFTGNTAGLTSGAISVGFPNVTDAYLYLDNSVFTNNVAQANGNRGTWGGGAIYFRGVNDDSAKCGGEIIGCEFVGNHADGPNACGGAFGVRMMPGTSYVPEPILVRNCLFAKNSCTFQGGAMYLINDSPTVDYVIESCTFADNTAKDANNGPSIYAARSGLCITNTVFASNLLYMNASYDFSAKCANCCFDPAQATSNYKMANAKDCVFADPKFVDQANGDYRLASKSSPCFDTGVAADWMATAFDLDGHTRLFGAKPDMGCYEFTYPLGFLMIVR